jgi:hypothetical protein
MSDKQKPRGRVESEEFDAGRILAVIKKKDPELFNEISDIARAENKKSSELIEEAFALYRDYKYMIGVDPRCLSYSMRLLQVLMQRVVEIMVFIQQYFGDQMAQQQQAIAQAIAESMRREQEQEKPKQPSVPVDVKSKIMNMTLDMVMNLMSTMMSNFTRMSPMQMPPMTQKNINTNFKPKVILDEPKPSPKPAPEPQEPEGEELEDEPDIGDEGGDEEDNQAGNGST